MKYFFLTLTLLVSYSCIAQLSNVNSKREEWKRFKTSTTYVVKSGDNNLDSEIEKAINEVWTITPFKFIDKQELQQKITDKSASFILLLEPTIRFLQSTAQARKGHLLGLIMGGKKVPELAWVDRGDNPFPDHYGWFELLAYSPINNYQNEPNDADCAFRVKNMIQGMLFAINTIHDNKITKSNIRYDNVTAREVANIYKQKIQNVKKRTLLICKDSYGSMDSKKDITKIYPHKFEICDKEKIAKVINEKNPKYYYLQPAISQTNYLFIIDPVTGEPIYASFSEDYGKKEIPPVRWKLLIKASN